ncbi:DUF4932 domain-containing protein [bacterium]|nr:DUF4932 domain-containing protein [bacterium]
MKSRPWAAAALAAMFVLPIAPALAQEAVPVPLPDPSGIELRAPGSEATAIEVRVEPQIELVTALIALGAWGKENAEVAPSAYALDVQQTFARHAAHPAVEAVSAYLKAEPAGLRPLLRLALTLDSTLSGASPIPSGLALSLGGSEAAGTLSAHLRQFAADSGFMAFYTARRPAYAKLEAKVAQAVAKADPKSRVEGFYGVTYPRFTVLLAPMAPRDASGEALLAQTGEDGPLVVLRPEGVTKDKLPDFKVEASDFGRSLAHAFGHAILPGLLAVHARDLALSKELMTPVTDDMKAAGCLDWPEAVAEHLLRAVDARFQQADGDVKQAQVALRTNERTGFAYVREIFTQLANYEANRATYPNLGAFLPQTTAKLAYLKDMGAADDVAKRYRSFQGPIPRANDRRFLPATVLVAPTPADAKVRAATQASLQETKAFFRKRFGQDVAIVTPEQAATLDPAKVSFVVFGTPWSNPFLAALLKYIPLKVTKDTIQLGDKQFVGKNLRLITAFSNPYNPNLPMRIVTSSEDAGIPGLFGMNVGPYDYALFHGESPMAQGDFVYDLKGKWNLR